ncbi:DUF4064 domain-containing protein [Halalkalibacter krulwichiae]|nr:DUF4064 domain-containing protein [Halalkalibacter krulwichiae]
MKRVFLLSLTSLLILFVALFYISLSGPLEKSSLAQTMLIELYKKDPKVQRDTASGTLKMSPEQFAYETLSFLNNYKHLPISALAFSAFLHVVSLIVMSRNKNISGSLFMCAAILSSFLIIPALLQVYLGYLLLKKDTSPITAAKS